MAREQGHHGWFSNTGILTISRIKAGKTRSGGNNESIQKDRHHCGSLIHHGDGGQSPQRAIFSTGECAKLSGECCC
jgi:hypothetical protein